MNITLNGKLRRIDPPQTVALLLAERLSGAGHTVPPPLASDVPGSRRVDTDSS